MGTGSRFIWSNMALKKWKEIRKCSNFLWVGGEKSKRFFHRLFFCAALRGSFKTRTERLHGRTGKACPLGEDWSGRFVRLPQGLWESKLLKARLILTFHLVISQDF